MALEIKTSIDFAGCKADAFEVRRIVFMEEQGYENEFEAIDDDPRCIHVTEYAQGELVGCARVFPEDPGAHAEPGGAAVARVSAR